MRMSNFEVEASLRTNTGIIRLGDGYASSRRVHDLAFMGAVVPAFSEALTLLLCPVHAVLILRIVILAMFPEVFLCIILHGACHFRSVIFGFPSASIELSEP